MFETSLLRRSLSLSLSAVLAPSIVLTTTFDAVAEDDQPPPRFYIGVGGYMSSSPFIGADDETGLIPYLAYEGDYITLDLSGLAVSPIKNEHLQISVVVRPRWILVEPEDSPALTGMDRDIGVDAGAALDLRHGPFSLSAEFLADITNENEGRELTLGAGYATSVLARGRFGVDAGARWRNEELATYLYGVFEDEALAGRPAFAVEETWHPYAGVTLSYAFTPKLLATIRAEAEFLPDAVQDSPIIDDDIALTSFFGILYGF